SNTLDGGEGDDKLTVNRSTDYYYQRNIAQHMNNTLWGGVGHDRLEGSVSADTYLFNRGDGQDVINDFDDNAWGKTDRIVLGEGITAGELSIRREGNHMVLLIGGNTSGDSLTIENAYTDARFRIEQVVLADGT
ncbi:calcium-binding protein, partial [Aeromonas hydrophila]